MIQVEPDGQRGFQAQEFPPLHPFILSPHGLLKERFHQGSSSALQRDLEPYDPLIFEPTFYPVFRTPGYSLFNSPRYESYLTPEATSTAFNGIRCGIRLHPHPAGGNPFLPSVLDISQIPIYGQTSSSPRNPCARNRPHPQRCSPS